MDFFAPSLASQALDNPGLLLRLLIDGGCACSLRGKEQAPRVADKIF